MVRLEPRPLPVRIPERDVVVMKIRCLPEDFRVEEVLADEPGRSGSHTLYRLEKRGLGTIEAIQTIARRWNLPIDRLHHGGLKDRHAVTIQYLTASRGPQQPIHEARLDLTPIGRRERPFGPRDFTGNRFAIVVRHLRNDQKRPVLDALATLAQDGLPNYFDDQRFGSLGVSGEFAARAWFLGDHERACWLAWADPNPHDRPRDRRQRALIRDHWGRWAEAKAALDRSHARSLVTFLVDHPQDFRRAFGLWRRPLRSLVFSSYQSHLWNRTLAALIVKLCRPDQLVEHPFRASRLPIPVRLDPEQVAAFGGWTIPLPSARQKPTDDPIDRAAIRVVESDRLAWDDLRIRGLKDLYLAKGNRPARITPQEIEFFWAADELHPGRSKVTVRFFLPRGAYATMLIKRIQAVLGLDGKTHEPPSVMEAETLSEGDDSSQTEPLATEVRSEVRTEAESQAQALAEDRNAAESS